MKNLKKVIIIIVIILISIWTITFAIDYFRCLAWKKPIFVIDGYRPDILYYDGAEEHIYKCLGYGGSYTEHPNLHNSITYISMSLFNIPILQKSRNPKELTNNMATTDRAVIVKVNESSLSVMGVQNKNNINDLYDVEFAKEGNIGFKQGQEILIYHDELGYTYDFQVEHDKIADVGKIEIIKEESNIQIPTSVYRYYYSSANKVSVSVKSITTKKAIIEITDTNEYKYEYSNAYTLFKKNTEKPNNNLIVDGNSVSISGYNPWIFIAESSNKLSDYYISIDNKNVDANTIEKVYTWENVCGDLTSGDYWLSIPGTGSSNYGISIYFTIKDNGEITYSMTK